MSARKVKTIETDALNSTSESIDLGGMKLILPGSSKIELGDSVVIRAISRKISSGNKGLKGLLYESVKRIKPDAVLVSGGIDSSVLAAIAVSLDKGVDLMVAG